MQERSSSRYELKTFYLFDVLHIYFDINVKSFYIMFVHIYSRNGEVLYVYLVESFLHMYYVYIDTRTGSPFQNAYIP